MGCPDPAIHSTLHKRESRMDARVEPGRARA
jgi:hypothetical protein